MKLQNINHPNSTSWQRIFSQILGKPTFPQESAPTKTPPKREQKPPRRERERPPKRDPWKPAKFPKIQPKPKAIRETFERSVNPGTNQFWANLAQSEHPFSKHPLLSTLGHEKAKKSWQKGVEALKRAFPQLQEMDNPQVMQQVPQLAMQAFQQISRAEAPYREQLMEIAIDVVHEVWGVPKDMLNPRFTDSPGMDGDADSIEQERDPNEADRLRGQINKRITMNAMIQGAAVQNMATIHHMVNERLNALAPELLKLYDQFASSSTSIYWIIDFAAMSNLADQAIGHVNVEQVDDGVQINANAMVFPVLVQELVKGVVEVLAMPGFEDLDESDTDTVMHHADRLEDEPWLIQVGPQLWEAFLKIVPRNHPLASVIPHLAAKDPEFIHDLLVDTVKAIHNNDEPKAQARILAKMMDEIEEAQDEYDMNQMDSHEPWSDEGDESWDVGDPI